MVMASLKIKIKRNVYVKGYKRFPYQKLTGKHYLYYSGNMIFYEDVLPDEYDSRVDFAFDCECEYEEWSKVIKTTK